MRLTCNEDIGSSILSLGTNFNEDNMAEEIKKSKNPFINAANAARAVANNPKVPNSTTVQVQATKNHGSQVSTNKPTKKSARRGR